MRSYYLVVLVIVSSFILPSCASKTPRNVMIQQYGDDSKSCKALELELNQTQQEMSRILGEQNSTSGTNAALAVAGAFLFWPALFFMDLSDSEEQEYDSYRLRYNHLLVIATDKECGVDSSPAPSIKEMKAKAKEQKRKKQEAKRTAYQEEEQQE